MSDQNSAAPRAPAELSPSQDQFPGGVLQLNDVLENGYWHARELAYTGRSSARLIEWLRTPGDLVFIFVGVLPALAAVLQCYFDMRKHHRG